MGRVRVLEARFCRFAAPEAWTPLGGVGLAEPPGPGVRRCAAVSESWLDPRPPLAELAATVQVDFLRRQPGARVTAACPAAVAGCAESWLTTYSLPGGAVLRQLWAASGPLVCTLAVTVPDDESAGGLSAAVLESFEVPAAAWASAVRRVALATRHAGPDGLQPTVVCPELHAELHLPPGWGWDPAGGRGFRERATLALRFDGLGGGDAEGRFAEALARLSREEGRTVTGWEMGELPAGGCFRAVQSRYVPRRTWGKTDGTTRWEAFAESKGVLAMALEAPLDDPVGGDLGAMLGGLRWLPPERWRTTVRRPWLDAVLEGPWLETAAGVFARTTAPAAAVVLAELPGEGGLAWAAQLGASALLPVDEEATVTRHELDPAQVESGDAFRLCLDVTGPDGRREIARGVWMGDEQAVRTVLVRGADEGVVASTLAVLLAGVRRPAREVEP